MTTQNKFYRPEVSTSLEKAIDVLSFLTRKTKRTLLNDAISTYLLTTFKAIANNSPSPDDREVSKIWIDYLKELKEE